LKLALNLTGPFKLSSIENAHFNLSQYIHEHPLTSSMPLANNGAVSFHWGDWENSCQFLFDLLKNNPEEQNKRLKELDLIIQSLRDQTVWVNNRETTMKVTLLDLYRSYNSPEIRNIWFNDDKEVLQISFAGEMGPYVPISSMRWFHKEAYSCYVFKNILQKQRQNRSFRLGFQSPIFCQFDQQVIDKHNIRIHQIMKNGILFRIKGIESFNRFLVSSEVILQFSADLFKTLLKAKSGQDMTSILKNESINLLNYGSQIEFKIYPREVAVKYGNLHGQKLCIADDFYVFISWEDLQKNCTDLKFSDLMDMFVQSAEKIFTKELKKIA
jgi:hypothetical protein